MVNVHRSDQPVDRLTWLCDQMVDVIDTEENADIKAVIMLSSSTEHRGGIVLHGYDDTTDGLTDVFVHLNAIFESQGKRMMLMGEDGFIDLGAPRDG